MDKFQGRITRSRASMGTPGTNPVKQEIVETPFHTPATTIKKKRGRKPLTVKENSLLVSKIKRRSGRISMKEKQKIETMKTVSIIETEEDNVAPKIVGFMVKPEGKIFYGVSVEHGGPVTFVSSEIVKDKIPFSIIEFCEKNALWKTRKWGCITDSMKSTLSICDKNDLEDVTEDNSRCSIQ